MNKTAPTESGARAQYLSYYHIMQGRNRNYNAFETSVVEDWAVCVLCGEGDYKVPPPFLSLSLSLYVWWC